MFQLKRDPNYKIIEKATQPIPDTCCIWQQINYSEIKANNILLRARMSTAFSDSLFSWCMMPPGEKFLSHGNGALDETL
jgi:hypothetical protein